MSLAISTTAFIATLGVNTHFDFQNYGYQNVATAETSIRYLGLTNLPDSAQTTLDYTLWKQVADATGAKFMGNNRITTGANNDTIRFGGSGILINAGAGNNTLVESGSNSVIVPPAANKGYDDIFGNVLNNGDKLDLRPMLAASWKGDLANIGNFLKLSTSSRAVISVDPDGVAGGSVYAVLKLEGSGTVSLSTLLAHSITS